VAERRHRDRPEGHREPLADPRLLRADRVAVPRVPVGGGRRRSLEDPGGSGRCRRLVPGDRDGDAGQRHARRRRNARHAPDRRRFDTHRRRRHGKPAGGAGPRELCHVADGQGHEEIRRARTCRGERCNRNERPAAGGHRGEFLRLSHPAQQARGIDGAGGRGPAQPDLPGRRAEQAQAADLRLARDAREITVERGRQPLRARCLRDRQPDGLGMDSGTRRAGGSRHAARVPRP